MGEIIKDPRQPGLFDNMQSKRTRMMVIQCELCEGTGLVRGKAIASAPIYPCQGCDKGWVKIITEV